MQDAAGVAWCQSYGAVSATLGDQVIDDLDHFERHFPAAKERSGWGSGHGLENKVWLVSKAAAGLCLPRCPPVCYSFSVPVAVVLSQLLQS